MITNFNTSFFDNSSNRVFIVSVATTTVLITVIAFLMVYNILVFYRRRKLKSYKASIMNLRVMSCVGVSTVAVCILSILTWIYGTGNLGTNPTRKGIIAITVVTAIGDFAICLYLIFYLHYLSIAIDDVHVYFLSEKIKITSVISFEKAKERNNFLLIYRLPNGNNRKVKFFQSSLTGQFLNKNKQLFVHFDDENEAPAVSQQAPEITAQSSTIASKPKGKGTRTELAE